MSLAPLSTLADIKGLVQLVPRKNIYLVENGDGQQLVVKGEVHGGDTATVSHALGLVAKLSPGGETRVLTSSELDALTEYASDYMKTAKMLRLAPEAFMVEFDALLNHTANAKWVKMRQIDNLTTLADAINALKTQDPNRKQGVRTFARMLNGGHGLEALGRMVAIDAYNHNTDRFDPLLIMGKDLGQPGMAVETQDGPTRTERRVMVNSGNVFMTFQSGCNLLVGLDSYDPSSAFHLSAKISEREKIAGRWAGWILQDNARARAWRKTYSELIAADLEDALGPRNRRFGFLKQTRLDSNAPARLRAGFKFGIEILTTELIRLRNRGGMSPGLQERYDILVLGLGEPRKG
ncbi:MAG: hypothetical protein MUF00_03685 [Gemmatimonadaceae bacterium]|jgi:hypothetical protein|nr:hypothetical protein [Gemmatimonadaceae bacterium]